MVSMMAGGEPPTLRLPTLAVAVVVTDAVAAPGEFAGGLRWAAAAAAAAPTSTPSSMGDGTSRPRPPLRGDRRRCAAIEGDQLGGRSHRTSLVSRW